MKRKRKERKERNLKKEKKRKINGAVARVKKGERQW
jgi:hypothetical protein